MRQTVIIRDEAGRALVVMDDPSAADLAAGLSMMRFGHVVEIRRHTDHAFFSTANRSVVEAAHFWNCTQQEALMRIKQLQMDYRFVVKRKKHGPRGEILTTYRLVGEA